MTCRIKCGGFRVPLRFIIYFNYCRCWQNEIVFCFPFLCFFIVVLVFICLFVFFFSPLFSLGNTGEWILVPYQSHPSWLKKIKILLLSTLIEKNKKRKERIRRREHCISLMKSTAIFARLFSWKRAVSLRGHEVP